MSWHVCIFIFALAVLSIAADGRGLQAISKKRYDASSTDGIRMKHPRSNPLRALQTLFLVHHPVTALRPVMARTLRQSLSPLRTGHQRRSAPRSGTRFSFSGQVATMASNGEPPAMRVQLHENEVSLDMLLHRLRDTTVCAKLPEAEFICTHHGTFHADEAMACAMLKCLPAYANMPILRTRNQADIDKAAIAVDVGGIYDAEEQRYDHHQKTFTSTYSDAYAGIKLSSAGLVYKHFAPHIVEALCGKLDPKALSVIVSKTYNSLIRELDAIDNGVEIADEPRYGFVTHLAARIGRLNPNWQEPNSPDIENARFKDAMGVAAQELFDIVYQYSSNWLPAYSIVHDALATRREVHASGEIVKLPRFCPWTEHLFDLEDESETNRMPLTKYILFQDTRGGWRVKAAPKVRGSFESRLPLPKAWRGLREDALDEVTGIPGGVFVHASGFIGGHTTEDGALAMASKALALATTVG